MSVRLVVAKYNEDTSWTKKIKNHNITIYDKSETPIDGGIKLPNIGRESHTFLHHIVQNYDNLDDITVFLQANPFEHIQVLKGWQYFGLPNAPYPPPLTETELNKMYEKMNSEITATSELSSFYQVIYNDPPYTNGANVNKFLSYILDTNINHNLFTVSPGAQYIVPKKYILSRSLETWKKILNTFIQVNTNDLGYNMELSWFYLFTNKIANVSTHNIEKMKLDGNKKYGFHHTLNSWQDISKY